MSKEELSQFIDKLKAERNTHVLDVICEALDDAIESLEVLQDGIIFSGDREESK